MFFEVSEVFESLRPLQKRGVLMVRSTHTRQFSFVFSQKREKEWRAFIKRNLRLKQRIKLKLEEREYD